jgi:DNA-binding transcriptional ArsR family regulator
MKFNKPFFKTNLYRNIAILKYMGTTKSDHFSVKQNQIANIAKAIGHPARVAILDYLTKVDSCICSDIVNELPLAQPTISQHIKELKTAGLIKGNIEGNVICYCIDEKAIEKIQAYFTKLAGAIANHKNTCC